MCNDSRCQDCTCREDKRDTNLFELYIGINLFPSIKLIPCRYMSFKLLNIHLVLLPAIHTVWLWRSAPCWINQIKHKPLRYSFLLFLINLINSIDSKEQLLVGQLEKRNLNVKIINVITSLNLYFICLNLNIVIYIFYIFRIEYRV